MAGASLILWLTLAPRARGRPSGLRQIDVKNPCLPWFMQPELPTNCMQITFLKMGSHFPTDYGCLLRMLSVPFQFISNWQRQTITLASHFSSSQLAHQSVNKILIQSLFCMRRCARSVWRAEKARPLQGSSALCILYKPRRIANLFLISSVNSCFLLSGFPKEVPVCAE